MLRNYDGIHIYMNAEQICCRAVTILLMLHQWPQPFEGDSEVGELKMHLHFLNGYDAGNRFVLCSDGETPGVWRISEESTGRRYYFWTSSSLKALFQTFCLSYYREIQYDGYLGVKHIPCLQSADQQLG